MKGCESQNSINSIKQEVKKKDKERISPILQN